MAFLKIAHLEKFFGPMQVVKDFNLEVEQGEFVSLLGPSGCGKTTVLRMVAGFEAPTSGVISIEDQDVVRLKPNQRNIGMVFQAYALFPNLTVRRTWLSGCASRACHAVKSKAALPRSLGSDRPARSGKPLSVPAFGGPATARGIGARAGGATSGAAAG